MSFNNSLENSLLDQVWGDAAYSPPANWYVGLSSTPPQEDGTGITEPATLDGYARVEVANNLTQWPAATTEANVGTKQNGQEIEFPTATDPWGSVEYFFFADDATATGANVKAYGTLDEAKSIGTGDTAAFAPEAITIQLD